MSWFVAGTWLLARLDLVVEVHVSTGGSTGFSGCPVDFVVTLRGYQRLVNVGRGRRTAVVCGKLCGSAAEKVTVSCCLQVGSGMSAVVGIDLAPRLLLFAEGSSLSGLTALRSRRFGILWWARHMVNAPLLAKGYKFLTAILGAIVGY